MTEIKRGEAIRHGFSLFYFFDYYDNKKFVKHAFLLLEKRFLYPVEDHEGQIGLCVAV